MDTLLFIKLNMVNNRVNKIVGMINISVGRVSELTRGFKNGGGNSLKSDENTWNIVIPIPT
ncbi:MAG TPA: hypothetical protein VLB82_04115 [Thermodesulfobacteriota bacterium]|nr:hypothetical protein [Thermodesulfobacteriota bacterium]